MMHLDSLDDLERQLQTNPNGSNISYTDPISGKQYSSLPNSQPLPITPSPAPIGQKPEDKPAEQVKQNLFRGDKNNGFAGHPDPRDATNNFGYIDKPGWMGLTSAVPGMIGLAGKAVNAGINANNMEAVDTARNMLGLEDKGGLKDVLRDNQGYVGDVGINNHQYGVSLEAMTPDNRTALTPTEANTRSNLLGGLQEKQPVHDEHTGILNSIFDDASNFFSNLFSTEDTTAPNLSNTGSFPAGPAPTPGTIDSRTIPGPWGTAQNNYGHDTNSTPGNYSGLGGEDSPSEHGPGPGMGLGAPDKEKDKKN